MPALEVDGRVLIQSPAIIEWLEEKYPTPALLPAAADDRARVRALAAIVGCDIHPVNNRRILETLRHDFGADAAAIDRWCSLDRRRLRRLRGPAGGRCGRGRFSFGDTPTLADVYLVPQVESARRFKVDLAPIP